MITIKDKSDCCGCTACATTCPTKCISMQIDSEGFAYPSVDASRCVNCNLCVNICPIISLRKKPQHSRSFDTSLALAAKTLDKDTLLKSSSGGIFSEIALHYLRQGWIVVGAAFVDGTVKHICISNIKDLAQLRGSKYVQSDLSDIFNQILAFLKSGQRILFSGTPCQVAGLKSLTKKYSDSLVTIEVACHGAPSPKALSAYFDELELSYSVRPTSIAFRAKPTGWEDYHIEGMHDDTVLFSEHHKANVFMRGFLHELYSRPACHCCDFKANNSAADFTLADFWGIQNISSVKSDFSNGISLVIANSEVAKSIIPQLNIEYTQVEVYSALRENGSLLHSENPHPLRKRFFKAISKGKTFSIAVEKSLQIPLWLKAKLFAKSYCRKFGIIK